MQPVFLDPLMLVAVPARRALAAEPPAQQAKVENAVLVAQLWILACLRNRTFSASNVLSEAISELLERLNARAFKKLDGCRRSAFEDIDQPSALHANAAPPSRARGWLLHASMKRIRHCPRHTPSPCMSLP
jgi:hypothetical protein